MKKFKKLSAILLAMIMTMLVALPAMAAGTKKDVTLPLGDTVYEAYRVFDVEYNNPSDTNSAKVYTINSETNPFYNVLFGTSNEWFDATFAPEKGSNIYVVTAKESIDDKDARAIADFLKKEIDKDPTKFVDAKTDLQNDVNIKLDDNGYYLIYAPSVGSAGLALLSGGQDLDITSKITKNPTITKKVTHVNDQENTTEPGKAVPVSVGDKITFEIVVNIPKTIDSRKTPIKIVDESEAGLKIQTGEITVTPNIDIESSPLETGFTLNIPATAYTSLGEDKTVTITYNAILNPSGTDKNKFTNTATMTFDGVSTKVAASVISNISPVPKPDEGGSDDGAKGPWSLLKVDADKKYLKGAKFQIFRTEKDANDGTNPIHFDWKENRYTATVADLTGTVVDTIDLTCGSGVNGPTDSPKADILGLGGTVYVKETVAPKGYNALTKVLTVNLATASTNGVDSNGIINFPGQCENIADTSGVWQETDKGLAVINTTGALLPSTGGIGTTIFYIAGAILLLGAVVMLVVRRRMDK